MKLGVCYQKTQLNFYMVATLFSEDVNLKNNVV